MTSGGRHVALLAANQALALSAGVLSMALAGIPGAVLAPDKDLATLPDHGDGLSACALVA